MKGPEWKYAVLVASSSVGVAIVLAALLGAVAFVAYMALYLLAFSSSTTMHNAMQKIANGKEQKK